MVSGGIPGASQPIEPSVAIKFLREAANYFRGRDTRGEDMAVWANVYNAENCERIAALIEGMQAPVVKED